MLVNIGKLKQDYNLNYVSDKLFASVKMKGIKILCGLGRVQKT